eukprot:g24884.t1
MVPSKVLEKNLVRAVSVRPVQFISQVNNRKGASKTVYADFQKERNRDKTKVFRNADPELHPFERSREYTRALNATKLDKVFAKPLICALDGHRDGVWCMTTVPGSLVHFASGSADGELRLWHLGTRSLAWALKAHEGIVRSVTADDSGKFLLTCGAERTVKMWAVQKEAAPIDDETGRVMPVSCFLGKNGFSGVDYESKSIRFATCGTQVDLWDVNRSEPLHSFTWGADSVNSISYNRVETQLLLSCGSDRNLVLYDTRSRTPNKKIIMTMQTNAVCWNPQEAFIFTTANEDHKCYTFDLRKLQHSLRIHEDHVSAVMSIAYNPTGKQFVTGSYDRTVRLFNVEQGHSYDVYHTQRMQRVFSVKWSSDTKYVMSGSDDHNVRVWKANASERTTLVMPRQRRQENYQEKLKQRFAHVPELKRIATHHRVPSAVLKARQLKHTMRKSRVRKAQNVRRHSKNPEKPKSAKVEAVVRQYE